MASFVELREDLARRPAYRSPQESVDVRLNTNEAPEPPPSEWLEDLARELRGIPFNRYPDRSARALRDGLAELHGVSPDQILAANGSNEVIQLLLLAYGGPGRTAALWEPTYGLHSLIARLTSTRVVAGDRRSDFALDEDEVERVLRDQPEITFLCSPNNPTGRAESPDMIKWVIDRAPGLVIVDEAYGQFARWSALSVVDDDAPVAVVRTFSKTWAMAGLRLGYLVASSRIVSDVDRATLPYHLDAAKQVAGRLALRHRIEMEARVEAVMGERERLYERLSAMPLEVWPSDANFLLFRPKGREATEVWELLLARSILIRDFSASRGTEGCLRVTVGTQQENDSFVAALSRILA